MKQILLLNGPNLNLLGQRQPEIYGHATLADVERDAVALGNELGVAVTCKQSNHEGVLVDWIQEARSTAAGIVINPAAYSHTSVAILDALNMFDGPVIEVHISDIHQREAFRHHSFVTHRADETIIGEGVAGYARALRLLVARL
ncbi:type II 3-dehydroquinate dehydratase [Thalassorhabdomicrobium marinisediminis]|uniref:3-dehydroquinate dehydratase n=1 Tax=Thalassorhabdomicrobium marinisediminis TaxID=2170577 RepID=A0A2T7G007_9RHOB|nr:type II 3-dehydroquinate dehydratase [Thalassorhabdomicrobium marinisediminis]PVA07750.1 type II 3-dehydroquinate dehydratase [Thalassorhabdomicrobium marinisediminis]